jgi:heparinase II/III-like protein
LKKRRSRVGPITLLSVAAPFVALFAVLFPEVRHYYVRAPAVTAESLAALRSGPPDTVLSELGRMSFFTPRKATPAQTLKMGEDVLQGRFEFPDFPGGPLDLPLDPDQVNARLPEYQLKLAGLLVADVLMDAYGVSGDAKYLAAAHRHILETLKEDRRRFWPEGFLWNDHAIAGRIGVLARYWKLYRNHPSYDAQDAALILQGAHRGALMLAKPGAFTFSTNHGVMQNLALLHFCVAFPGLDRDHTLRDTALARFSAQMRFYVSDSGVVMEHSTGYHDFGLTLVGMGLRYCRLLDVPIPPEWAAQYAGMIRFHHLITRPDGTLPLYGDTEWLSYPPLMVAESDSGKGPLRPLAPEPPRVRNAVDAAAGYAVFWSAPGTHPPAGGADAQVLMAWPNFISRAHKRADEMSLLFWAKGKDWWTGMGYLPYGMQYRDKAEGWDGSNAPHAIGEKAGIPRATVLERFAGEDGGSYYLDLERRTADGYRARRQLLYLPPGLWLVLDAVSDSLKRRSHVVWTASPSMRIRARGAEVAKGEDGGGGEKAFDITDTVSAAALKAVVDVLPAPPPGSAGPAILRGSTEPFAGWMSMEKGIRKADALLFDLASGSQAAMAWALDTLGQTLASVTLTEYRPDGAWKARIAVRGDTLALACDGQALEITPANGKSGAARLRLELQPAPGPERRYGKMTAAFLEVSGKYTRYQESFAPYREKWILILLGLFCLQEAFFLAMRFFPPAAGLALRGVSLVFWTGLTLWLSLVYFGP